MVGPLGLVDEVVFFVLHWHFQILHIGALTVTWEYNAAPEDQNGPQKL